MTDKRITSLTFELVPWYYVNEKNHLRIAVVVNGQGFDYNEVLEVDDTVALIDRFFDVARDKIKRHIDHELGEESKE